MTKQDEVLKLLEECSTEERVAIFKHLRKEIPIHALEAKLNTQAEVILEAMDRASDLTMRGCGGYAA
jgi:Mg/Co/Ni transporter MgtE